MYKLLVVDDEKQIAQGIANGTPWNSWGFTISGVCSNGLEAIENIKTDKPDVVLSDIRMAKMDGVELMNYLNKHYPEIKIIILSGYNDFEYLQMSIKNRVMEYLLKPTDLDEFEALFLKVKKSLDEERQKEEERQELKQIGEEGKHLKLHTKYNALLRGYGYNEEEMDEEFYLDDGRRYGVVIFGIDDAAINSADKKDYYRKQMLVVDCLNKLILEESISGTYFLNFEEKICSILSLLEEQGEQELLSYLEYLIEGVYNNCKINILSGVSSFHDNFQMLPQCYEQAKCCISQRIFNKEKQRIIFYKELCEADFDYYAVSFDTDKLVKYILEQNKDKLESELSQVFAAFENKVVRDYDYVNRMSLELLFNLSRRMLAHSVRLETVMKEMGCVYTDIYEQKSLETKKSFLMGILERLCEAVLLMRGENKKRSSLAKAVRDIVDEEFASNNMSLEYVAGKVNKNKAYISKIFKNELGCNFSDYVTQKRLKQSRQLLKNPALKVYEISEQLGWVDVSNFIKVFKKKYGMSPNEYRNILEKEITFEK